MAAGFLVLSSFGVIFFLVYLWQIAKSLKPEGSSSQPRPSKERLWTDSAFGRRTFAYLERQMADFLGTQHSSVPLLLVGAVLTCAAAQLKAQDGNAPAPATAPMAVDQGDQASPAVGNSATGDAVKTDQPAAATDSSTPLTGNFWQRFGKAYLADWNPSADSGPEPKYRGYPAPLTNPPFPFAVWPYGGSVTIGYPWTQAGPLMEAIWSGKDGEAWKKSGIQIYGWINGG
ncbi:MAG TPA: hypothetical protein VE779_13210, partial [Candidatus Angelobacter sp.]|nr:hypothetical protein [Candidatus Angelobacter sp.]